MKALTLRFLSALAAGGAAASLSLSACGGAVDNGPGGTTGNGGSSGSSGSSGGSGTGSSGTIGTPNPPATVPDASAMPTASCDYGKSETQCFTHEGLVALQKSPPRGGDAWPDSGEPPTLPFDANGCLPASNVQDGCCTPASAGPVFTANTCCYAFCVGGCCGRPLVVDGAARTANVIDRNDWIVACESDDRPHHLDVFFGDVIADAWARDAAMEHASVASFAKFTLELLAHAAPADLVARAQRAGLEEIEHARLCFAIASRHAGRTLGPDRLDVSGIDAARSLADVVRDAVREGCVGETLSASLASARLALAEDEDARRALAKIVDDEANHAELAFAFVGWAARVGGPEVIRAIREAFADARSSPPDVADASLVGVPADLLRAVGLLDPGTARAVAAQAFAEVIEPCALVFEDRAAA